MKLEGRERRRRLGELALLFFRLGATAFGGPAAHVALMEDEVVTRRRWISREEFLDLLGATNLIPGPNSTEMAIHVGLRRAGAAGLLVAGACFVLPAALITLALAVLYVRFGAVPEARGVLYGIKPVMIAIVLQALARLGRTAVKSLRLAAIGGAATAAAALGAPELGVLLGAGAIALVVAPRRVAGAPRSREDGSLVVLAPAALATAGASAPTAPALFLVFAKIGSLLFGSGYVLLAFLRTELVTARGWLTDGQLLTAVAVGQVTPGPVFTTATFVGYLVGGLAGALGATAGIFLPAFVFVAASGALVPKLRASARAGAFLDGVNVGSLALMAVVTSQLARASLVDVITCAIATGALASLLLVRRLNAAWLVVMGAAVGLVSVGH